jgi:hypothetical protein
MARSFTLQSGERQAAETIKAMLMTLLFKSACVQAARKFNIKNVRAILIRCARKDERAFAFDDLQVVKWKASP